MAADPTIQRKVNKWSARIIPFILLGLLGYVTWVIIVLIAVHYLLHPLQPVPARHGAAIAIIVIHCLFLPLFTFTYLRVIQVIITNPGFVPLPTARDEEKRAYEEKGFLDRPSIIQGQVLPPPGLAHFYTRDIYECHVDGLPRWCPTCKIWKPDRSHHCREVDRCVYKMDHYCPWAGGIVSETSFKFFFQFCTIGAFFNLYVLIVSAYFTKELQQKGFSYNVNWIITIAITGLFLLFSLGIALNSSRFVFTNSTTVDDLTQKSRVMHFAVLISNTPTDPDTVLPFATITYPLRSPSDTPSIIQDVPSRTFAILETPIGSNPYDLASKLSNFKSVMGNHWYDWFLPLKYSPCHERRVRHTAEESGSPRSDPYELGPVVEEMKERAALSSASIKLEEPERNGRKGRRDHDNRTPSNHDR